MSKGIVMVIISSFFLWKVAQRKIWHLKAAVNHREVGGRGGGNERVSEELSATPLQTGFSLCGSFIKNVALPFQIFKAS